MLFEVTSFTWMVTGLGFGIVLSLLFCLVFILMFFGWIMQKVTAPKAPKPQAQPTTATQSAPASTPIEQSAPQVQTEAKPVPEDDVPAIAYAIYLASLSSNHDEPVAMITKQARDTAWNTKSFGLNNVGF